MLAFAITAFFTHAQSVDNPQPEKATVNSQSHTTVNNPGENNLLGLPPVPIPENNPQTPAKIELGDKLFHDKRFYVDGTVSCAKYHDDNRAFTDNLTVSVGHNGLTGTRNVPTVLNAAFNFLALALSTILRPDGTISAEIDRPMNRADPFFDRDANDWQIINLPNGRVELNYTLYNNVNRIVRYNAKTKHPEDSVYQSENTRIPPQTH